jgi:isocitrate dehydrogenase
MGNSNSVNSISIIKTEGKDVTGISFVYNKEDEAKIIAKIKETLEAHTEEKDLRSIIEDTKTESSEEPTKKIINKLEDTLATKTETYPVAK